MNQIEIQTELPPPRVSRFTHFMWWCSGSVIEILKQLPTEKNKYVGMGAAIFGTWILATLSGIFAFYTIFHQELTAIFLGLIYGLFIFNLDRFITSSMRKTTSTIDFMFWHEKMGFFFRSEFMPAIPRILIALIIGFAISKPLELQIFKKEIQAQLNLEKEGKLGEKAQSLKSTREEIQHIESSIAAIRKEIAYELSKVDLLRDEYLGEIDGTRGSRVAGVSVIAMAKKGEYDNQRSAFDILYQEKNDEIRSLQNEIALIKEKRGKEIAEYEQEIQNIGFSDQIKALSVLIHKEGNSPIYWVNFVITFLIILIESSPILVKLISSKGPYDSMLEFVNESTMIRFERELKKLRYPKYSLPSPDQVQ